MSQHRKTDFKNFTKPQMDAGLVLHGLEATTPSQLSDGFRCGADWGASEALKRLTAQAPAADKSVAFEAWIKELAVVFGESCIASDGQLRVKYSIALEDFFKKHSFASPAQQAVNTSTNSH